MRASYCDVRMFSAYRLLLGKPIPKELAKKLELNCLRARRLEDQDDIYQTAEWLKTRELVPGARKVPYELPWSWWEHGNVAGGCGTDAFLNAADTLRDRIRRYGAESPGVREWLAGQDAVFSNCLRMHERPSELTDAPQWLLADRTYQMAATLFYQTDWIGATERFRQIAEDRSSPWQKYGLYLVARTQLRQATDGDYSAAEETARQVLADPSLAEVHPAAKKMLGFIAASVRPAERLEELEDRLLADDLANADEQDVIDFVILASRDSTVGQYAQWRRSFDPDNSGIALEGWRRERNTAWLVAALHSAKPDDAHADLLEEAARIPPSSPAWISVSWHRLRLFLETGRVDEARQLADMVLARRELARPIRNRFLMERFRVARDLSEIARYARLPMNRISMDGSTISDFSRYYTTRWRKELRDPAAHPEYFFPASASLMSHALPLESLAWLALDSGMPDHLRRDLLLNVFTRAVVLENWPIADRLSRALSMYFPQFDGDWLAFRTADGEADLRYSAAILILRFPAADPWISIGLGYDWPRDSIGYSGPRWWGEVRLVDGPKWESPRFLSEQERAVAESENATVHLLPEACTFLGTSIVDRAKARPNDPRLPEALHLVVRCTQYTYGRNNRTISRQAFRLLHEMFPDSPWARRTKFYY